MVEVDPTIPVIGPHGSVPLLDVFSGRRQLIAFTCGTPANPPPPNAKVARSTTRRSMTWYSVHDSADALLAGRGPFVLACYLRRGDRVFETYWTTGRGVEAMDNSYALLDLTVYGRQEVWEDSPPGWPRMPAASHSQHALVSLSSTTRTDSGRREFGWDGGAA